MENASKALIIAAGVILALLIIPIIVFIVGKFQITSESYVTKLTAIELNKYNSNFDVYIDRKDITAQEIISLINIAQEKEQGTDIYINTTKVTNWTEQEKNTFLSNNILTHTVVEGNEQATNLFEYVSSNYDDYGKVIEIRFKKK